jgi:hypothetical protein
MLKQFYKDEYATVEIDDELPCIKLTLTGVPRFSEHYQQVQAKRLELMHREIKNFDRLHMLTDSRAAGPVLDEDVMHFKKHVLPEMERAGIRYLAVVLPPGKFTRETVRQMVIDADKLEVKKFDDIREARHWLRTKSTVLN